MQSMQFSTILAQHIDLSEFMKAGATQLVQTSKLLKLQSLHFSNIEEQQLFLFLLTKPFKQPVQTEGESFWHLLQFPTCVLQQASESTLI